MVQGVASDTANSGLESPPARVWGPRFPPSDRASHDPNGWSVDTAKTVGLVVLRQHRHPAKHGISTTVLDHPNSYAMLAPRVIGTLGD